MNKTPASPARIAGLCAFMLICVLLLVYLWIDFGGSVPLAPQGYRVQVAFTQANELATGADVRIAGVNVGKVVALSADADQSRTLATLQIDGQYAPIPRDTRATLRIKTLLGETYVDLSTGDRQGGMMPSGGRLPNSQVEPDVALDQILSTFDPTTRQAFATWMVAQAGAVDGQGENINATLGEFPGFVAAAEHTLSTLQGQSRALSGLVANTGTFFRSVSARSADLQEFITAFDSFFDTTAARNTELAAIFKALPAFETQSRLALPALTQFGETADPVVRALDPIAPELDTTFADAATIAPEFRRLFARLGPTVTASKQGLPALDTILAQIPPLLKAFNPWLRNANPMVSYIGKFAPDITGFFANVADSAQVSTSGSASGFGAPYVHLVRATQVLSPSSLAFLPHPIGSSRDDAYRTPDSYDDLASGLKVLSTAECSEGNPAQPTTTDPATLAAQISEYVFRSTSSTVAAPACRQAPLIGGFSTTFPELTAEPPATAVTAAAR